VGRNGKSLHVSSMGHHEQGLWRQGASDKSQQEATQGRLQEELRLGKTSANA